MIKPEISPELSILINAALKADGESQISTENPPINWDSVMNLARWHQVRPLLFHYLEKNRGIAVPEKYTQSLRNYVISRTVTNMTFLSISLDLHRQLLQHKIPSFLMKGALWSWMFYEKPGSREFGDVDYYIKKTSIKDSLKVLSHNGFEPDSYRNYLFENERVAALYLKTDYQLPLEPSEENALQSLEIQWNSSYPRYCYSFSWEELTAKMMDFPLLNTSVEVPNMENQLLMMLVHHAGIEQWDKLKYVADFIRLLRNEAENLDWDYITKTAKAKGFYRLLMESLGMVTVFTGENYLKYSPVNHSAVYPDKKLLAATIAHWENERPTLKSKSWRIFIFNFKYRDDWKIKVDILLAHLSYLTQWQLIWHKFLWYNRKRS